MRLVKALENSLEFEFNPHTYKKQAKEILLEKEITYRP